jgi:HD superfamily phosphohydrolase
MEVRDPIHGAITIDPPEVPVLESPFVQRLRNIKQMGFSELPFPGAVHSRYIHSVGTMHLAGLAFDAAFRDHAFSSAGVRAAFRRCVRLAALLHDVGHAPFSHCAEFAMPPLERLGIKVYAPEVLARRGAERASHEDYTVGVINHSALTGVLNNRFPFTARHVSALVSREVEVDDDFFVDAGLDYRRVLSQLISSELDVDRLDYLVRDSYFSGARYGQVDVNWLLTNLGLHIDRDRVGLALNRRAIYAFDDFMVARYHMFVMVYFHHKSVAFEEMLKRYINGPGCTYALPTGMDAYLHCDDVHMHAHLRQQSDPWARAIVARRPWRRVLELHGSLEEVSTDWADQRLTEAGIDHFSAGSVGKLSRYTVFGQKRDAAPPIYVLDNLPASRNRAEDLTRATAIFKRYQDERRIARIYVDPADLERAVKVLGVRSTPGQLSLGLDLG